ncbi:hypothetical protein L596_026695 [Steinernema carpocapsae]|uniref:G-protein coupled receptors family 1 profile domain-containing protein n=1 Tax=Steinernema carpocapsae TaxID=34508 RepID=A0A4U5M239_STECR|nr:hypothetical protein L596_026695 [Steinernema carpocapsae]
MALLSLFSLGLNGVVLTTIASNPEFSSYTSYRIMLLMGVFDVAQAVVHLTTAIFTLCQYQASHHVQTFLSAIVSPSYLAYVLVTIILSFNRFVLFCWPSREKQIFSATGNKLWILLVIACYLTFAGNQVSGKVRMFYSIEDYIWIFDFSYPWTRTGAFIAMILQLSGIFIAWCFYIAIAISLCRFGNGAGTSHRANVKILLQAVAIVVYSTVLNFFWHKIDLIFPPGVAQTAFMNMMWIGNSALSSLLCLIINGQVRKKIKSTIWKAFNVPVQTSTVQVSQVSNVNNTNSFTKLKLDGRSKSAINQIDQVEVQTL